MKRKIILRIAAGLVLFTCLGHTVGTFMPLPPEEVELIQTENAMKTAMIPFPIGKKQSYYDILFGNNISVSVFLFVTGICFTFLSSEENFNATLKKILLANSLGLLAIAWISLIYFFPVPAFCTGVAGILGGISSIRE